MMIEIGSGKMGIHAPIIKKGQVHVLFRPGAQGPIGIDRGPVLSEEEIDRYNPADFWLRITSAESCDVLISVLQRCASLMKETVQEYKASEKTVA